MATVQTFDTLAYAKSLIAKGFEKEKAEALAEVTQEFLVGDLATKEFVRDEMRMLEMRLKIWTGSIAVMMIGVIVTLIKLPF